MAAYGPAMTRFGTLCVAAGLALAVAACSQSTSTTQPSATASTTPSATSEEAPSGAPSLPSDAERQRRHDKPYIEAAEKFTVDLDTVRAAVTATRLEMLRIGGTAGEKLHGTDEHPKPLDQGTHLDPAIIAYFAGRLGVPVDKASDVMEFLIDEWNEYDELSEASAPGSADRLISHLATGLSITKARAAWYVMLLIGRPSGPPSDTPGGIEGAIVAALGVSQAQFDAALAK